MGELGEGERGQRRELRRLDLPMRRVLTARQCLQLVCMPSSINRALVFPCLLCFFLVTVLATDGTSADLERL